MLNIFKPQRNHFNTTHIYPTSKNSLTQISKKQQKKIIEIIFKTLLNINYTIQYITLSNINTNIFLYIINSFINPYSSTKKTTLFTTTYLLITKSYYLFLNITLIPLNSQIYSIFT